MELGRLLSRLPASTVRSRLRVTLTFGVFLVGSPQGALGITKRAQRPWREPFDDRITADDDTGTGGCCRDGRKPNNPLRSRPRRGLLRPTNNRPWPLVYVNLCDHLENPYSRLNRESCQPCRHLDALSRVIQPHITTGQSSTFVSRLVRPPRAPVQAGHHAGHAHE